MKKNLLYLVFIAIPFLSQANNINTVTTASVEYRTSVSLKLLSFTVSKKDNNSILDWKTAEEFGFSHFELERSNDGQEFSTIAVIFSGVTAYSFKDVNVFQKKMLVSYRLKLIDDNGKFTYSSVIEVLQK